MELKRTLNLYLVRLWDDEDDDLLWSAVIAADSEESAFSFVPADELAKLREDYAVEHTENKIGIALPDIQAGFVGAIAE